MSTFWSPIGNSAPKVRGRGEDFALESVPSGAERRATTGLFAVILGIPSALVFLLVGGSLVQAYGTVALVTGLAVAAVIIGVFGWVLTSYACESGLDSDLMSIVAGFGSRGSAVTSAIYSVNFVILFAVEDAIIAGAVSERYPAVSREMVFLFVGGLVLVLAWRGIASITSVMQVTLPFVVALFALAYFDAGNTGDAAPFWSAASTHHLDPTGWLSVLAALLAFVVNATVAADVGRFLRPESRRVGSALFGGVLQLLSFAGAAMLGAWLTHRLGAPDPGANLVALLGVWGIVCVVLSQLRINLINAYSGSLSLSNFGARGLGLSPGRQSWMVLLVVAATVCAMGNIHQHLITVLTFESVFVMAWASTLVGYILIYELRGGPTLSQADLDAVPAFNRVGLGALCLALIAGVPLAFGIAGELGQALAPLAAMVVAPIGVYGLRYGSAAESRVARSRMADGDAGRT